MLKFKFLVILCLLSFVGFGQQMRIGVYRDYSIKRIVFSYNQGSYTVLGDTTIIGNILPTEFVDIEQEGNALRLKVGVVDKGLFNRVYLLQNNLGSNVTLTPRNPSSAKARKYADNFELTSNGKDITIVNLVDIDNYLAGVVESEGGGGQHLEYYKVQALMSRTYALKYVNKHNKEGFALCDRVHCQAYHSMLRFTPTIQEAVEQTSGSIMVDKNDDLIDSYFHANCGGQTCEPDYVWNNSIPYLSTFKDTFCIYTKQATWEKRVSQKDWQNFLVQDYQYPIDDSLWTDKIFTFEQTDRKAFYISPALGIPLRDLRTKFNLRSTYFSCQPDGTDVLIKGRGYGHGVGLCQEGAMKMARAKLDFKQIAQFYFTGARVVDLSEKHFFKQLARVGPFILED